MTSERIASELAELARRGVAADYFENEAVVIYRNVPVGEGEPDVDIAVKVPSGYAAARIDLAALPEARWSLLDRLKGGTNDQGRFGADGQTWRLASYHPHINGGGPPWDPSQHGFHTYYDELVSWTHHVARSKP
jgi:hypothetical protein